MKKLLLILLFAPCMLFAQTPFDGTWMAKVDTAQLPKKPEVYFLDKDTYRCSTCIPKIEVKADGSDQKVTGHTYYDTVSARIVDDNTAEITNKKDGKTVYTETDAVSSDGNMLSTKFSDQTGGNKEPVTGEIVYKRVGKRPAGAHAISGSWRGEKVTSVSNNGLTVTYQGTENGLKMTAPTGQSYDAKFDGKDYPIDGDPGHTMVSLKRIGDSVEETDKRDGKVIGVSRMTVSADGKTIDVVFNDKRQGTTMTYKMEKQ